MKKTVEYNKPNIGKIYDCERHVPAAEIGGGTIRASRQLLLFDKRRGVTGLGIYLPQIEHYSIHSGGNWEPTHFSYFETPFEVVVDKKEPIKKRIKNAR